MRSEIYSNQSKNIDHKILTSLGESAINPKYLSDFVGQESMVSNLKIFIAAANSRKEVLDHVLLHGPPGLGKTTLSHIIANELNVNIKSISGPLISKIGELAAILSNLKEGEVLFVDEIHRLSKNIEEILYSAMEYFYIDLIIGDGPAAKSFRMQLPKFTLIGATTRSGMLTKPLKDRFGIPLKLDFYSIKELIHIVGHTATKLNTDIEEDACLSIAKSARGTPRIAIRLLKRIRDFYEISKEIKISNTLVLKSLQSLKIDELGLDLLDYKYINYLRSSHNGGPVGINTIATALSEDVDTVEEDIEPYLIQIGFINRTNRGRMLTSKCESYFSSKV